MKKIFVVSVLVITCALLHGQQLPYYSQYRNMDVLINPAFTGTKKLIDARLNYRKQWVGFSGAPVTQSVLVNSRFMKGKMGGGISFVSDETGPTERQMYSGHYAFHIRFPDVELSMGASAHMIKYTLAGEKLLLYQTQDPAINQTLTESDNTFNANFGVLLYNDRFHFGVSAQNMLEGKVELYESDSAKQGLIRMAPHYYFNVGYNIQTGTMLWEHSLMTSFIKGSPLGIDYNLKLNFTPEIFGGTSVRLKDAVALFVGYTFQEELQLTYSYDFLYSKLRTHQSGSHEVSLIYRTNLDKKRKYRVNPEFLRQKYNPF